jgi:hypothetical protein
MILRIIYIPLIFFSISLQLKSQCFTSPGNPIAGTANIGTVGKKLLRGNLFYRYSFSDQYFEQDKKTDFIYYDKALYNYMGTMIAYGLSNRITLEAEAGYFINKTIFYDERLPYTLPEYEKTGYGFTHAVTSLKYLLYHDDINLLKWSLGAGSKIPLRLKLQYSNGAILPVDVQPSAMAWGIVLQSFLLKENSLKALRYFMINRYEYNFTNNQDFKWGQALYTSLFISKHLHFRYEWLTENWTAIMQVRHEYRVHNLNYNLEDHIVNGSGGHLLLLVPQLNYTIREKWNISLLAEIPVYKYYNEVQLANKFALTFNIAGDIVLNDNQ